MKKENQDIIIQNIMDDPLTTEEQNIIKIQKVLSKLGWQWQENIFNDGYSDCYLVISKNNDPCIFDKTQGDAGWGRYGRLYCWQQALEWIKINK